MHFDSLEVGGVLLELWFDAFSHCHERDGSNVLTRMCWPDGKCYLDQENLTVELFGFIRDEYGKIDNG